MRSIPILVFLALANWSSCSGANDAFADRLVLAGSAFRIVGDNVGATKEPGEPNHARNEGGASVWWTWTAPTTAMHELSTAGSSFDTLLAVYTGSTLSNLTSVAFNDDDPLRDTADTSYIRFQAAAGTVLQIAVDGFGGAQGTIRLELTTLVAPSNDHFVAATLLSGLRASALGNNLAATREPGEPVHAGRMGGSSVWWTWTAPASATFQASTAGSSFNTLLAVYTGDTLSNLTQVAANDNEPGAPGTSLVRFLGVEGTIYHLAVDGLEGQEGTISLDLRFLPPPVNDSFSAATVLAGTEAAAAGANFAATKEAGEPDHAGNTGGASVWWTWIAPVDGTYDVRTSGSDFNTLLAIYTGSSVSNLQTVAFNDNEPGPLVGTSRLQFQAVSGRTYFLAVDGSGGKQGAIELGLRRIEPPANDAFDHAILLTGEHLLVFGSNLEATREPGEPNHVGNTGGASVWWAWTAPRDGRVTVATAGSSFDTLLAAYRGLAVGSLTLVAGNDDVPAPGDFTSRIQFTAAAGTAYRIVVDGFLGAQGVIELGLDQEGEPLAMVFGRPKRVLGGRIAWDLAVAPGWPVRVEASTNLVYWTPLLLTNPVGNTIQVELPAGPAWARFLRAVR